MHTSHAQLEAKHDKTAPTKTRLTIQATVISTATLQENGVQDKSKVQAGQKRKMVEAVSMVIPEAIPDSDLGPRLNPMPVSCTAFACHAGMRHAMHALIAVSAQQLQLYACRIHYACGC